MNEVATFTLIAVHSGGSQRVLCARCGRPLTRVYTVSDDQHGNDLSIGRECLADVLREGSFIDLAATLRRQMRAAAQWRTTEPPAFHYETPNLYVLRRVREMSHALIACKFYQLDLATFFPDDTRQGWAQCVIERAQRHGVCITVADVQQRHIRRIARACDANPFDFVRPLSEARKV